MQDIKSIIKNLGPVSISAFMQEIMFNPSKGYYKTKNPIGSQKDFITAPEISSIFSQLIAGYFFSIFSQQKLGQEMVFVEMGAGLGTMFCDILKTFLALSNKTENGSQILKNINLAIIEKNPVLTKIQQDKLASLNLKISWFSDFEDFKDSNKNRQIYLTCNELFDCLSINQFSKSSDQWREILVDLDKNENLIPRAEDFNPQKHHLIKKIAKENLDDNQISQNNIIFEHSFESLNFMNQLSAAIKKTGGMALIIDYGYLESPLKSTLQAIKSHEKVNIFEAQDPYECDLTSLVNFTALKNCAQKNNLQTSLITQREFLTSLGIEEKKGQSSDLDLAINRLISPDQMGDLFKCLLIW